MPGWRLGESRRPARDRPTRNVPSRSERAAPTAADRPGGGPRSPGRSAEAAIKRRDGSFTGHAASRRLPDLPGARRLLGILSLILVIGLGLTFFLTSPVFGVREIMVVGSAHLSSTEIVRLSGLTLGANIMKVPTSAIRNRLVQNPRIAEATVSRKLPGRLVVRVVEREGILLLPCGSQFAEIDASGLPLEFHRYVGALGLPVATGIAIPGVTLGARLSEEKLTSALACADALGLAGRAAVAEIHVGGGGEMTLYTRDGIPVYVGEAADLASKVSSLIGILADVAANHLRVAYVDVRYPRYPVVGALGDQGQPVGWADPDVFPTFGDP
jgi:cell division septal protein FtsQ